MQSIQNSDEQLKIWAMVDTIESLYQTREYSIPRLAERLNTSVTVVRKTLCQLNYYHGLKRDVDTQIGGRLVNGVHTPEKFLFLENCMFESEE